MDLLQLKAPPDRVALMADAIERDIKAGGDTHNERELTEIVSWLRYRLARIGHPGSQPPPR